MRNYGRIRTIKRGGHKFRVAKIKRGRFRGHNTILDIGFAGSQFKNVAGIKFF